MTQFNIKNKQTSKQTKNKSILKMSRGPESPKKISRQLRRYLTSLIIREMRIKTKMIYHLTSVRMAIINKKSNSTCQKECREKGIPVCTIVVNVNWQCHYEKHYRTSSKY